MRVLQFFVAVQAEDVVSLYGTPKEEIPPTSAAKSENGSFNFAAGTGNQVRKRASLPFIIKWLALFKLSLILENFLQKTQTLQVN